MFAAGKTELKEEDFESACVDLWKIPKILQKCLYEAIKRERKLEGAIPKKEVLSFFKKYFEADSP